MKLYESMARSRAFELAVADLWEQGHIPGEMHLGTGEEAVAAAVTDLMQEGDGVALCHRCTPVLTMLRVDLALLLKEMMGREDGLCRGWGGHMHLFSRQHLAASSGIVGAAGPTAAGFALAAKLLRPGSVGVAFFGDGAANQGLLLESLNLACAWSLPVVFVCKDNGWAITTRTSSVTGGDLVARARGFGLRADECDGGDVRAVWDLASTAFERARRGKGPSFLRCEVPRLDGHFLGDPMVKTAESPVTEGKEVFQKVLSAAFSRTGGGIGSRAVSMTKMVGLLVRARGKKRDSRNDPLVRATRFLGERREADWTRIDEAVLREIHAVVDSVVGRKD